MLFLTSNELKTEISNLKRKIQSLYGKDIVFLEHIALPCFGGEIILRFDYFKEEYCLEDIFNLELRIREFIQGKFLFNFVRSIYQKLGFLKNDLEEIFLEGLNKEVKIVLRF